MSSVVPVSSAITSFAVNANATRRSTRQRASSAPGDLLTQAAPTRALNTAHAPATFSALQNPASTRPIAATQSATTRATVNRLLDHCSNADAAVIFDTLPAVRSEAIVGNWRGVEVSREHPLSGLLPAFGWHGKRFESTESVHPLVFDAVGGGTFSVNPAFVPMSIGPWVPRSKAGKYVMTLLKPIVSTKEPHARLRQVEYRGVVSAAMIYDQLPIVDAFRQLDANTLLGAMDYRAHVEPFFFLLHRE